MCIARICDVRPQQQVDSRRPAAIAASTQTIPKDGWLEELWQTVFEHQTKHNTLKSVAQPHSNCAILIRVRSTSARFRSTFACTIFSRLSLPPSVNVTLDAPSAAAYRPTAPVPQPSSNTCCPCTPLLRNQRHIAAADGHSLPPSPTLSRPTRPRVSIASSCPEGSRGSVARGTGPIGDTSNCKAPSMIMSGHA